VKSRTPPHRPGTLSTHFGTRAGIPTTPNHRTAQRFVPSLTEIDAIYIGPARQRYKTGDDQTRGMTILLLILNTAISMPCPFAACGRSSMRCTGDIHFLSRSGSGQSRRWILPKRCAVRSNIVYPAWQLVPTCLPRHSHLTLTHTAHAHPTQWREVAIIRSMRGNKRGLAFDPSTL
jgi:hypothetical protein